MTDIEKTILDDFQKYIDELDENCPVVLMNAYSLLKEKLNEC